MYEFTPREYLIYLSILANGEHFKMLEMLKNKQEAKVSEIRKAMQTVKSKVITYLDPEYPSYLKRYDHPPLVLFYYGDISLINEENMNNSVAIIGTRKPTNYGLTATSEIVKGLYKDKVIVSGMAKGIDAQAHWETIKNGGKTVAVLGSGIDNVYPIENTDLYFEIIKSGGLVISEHPNMVTPDAIHFPFRNRLIVQFSKGVLVTEAFEKSGTSITVGHALRMNKDVMCIPYPYYIKESFCNELIYEGSFLVRDSEDVRLVLDGGRNIVF